MKKVTKINWNAVTAIAAIFALITTVIISSIQMERSRELFEKQFTFDTSYSRKQFVFDTTYLQDQIQLMKEEMSLNLKQIKRNDSINKLSMDLTKQAITHDDKNKSRIIPEILFMDLLEKHWNLKLLQELLNENYNKARIDYIFKTKLNTSIYSSINNYDLFLALNDNPDLAYQIVSIYNNISKIHEEYINESFNQRIDTINGIKFPFRFPAVLGNVFNDISILEGTLHNIRDAIKSINDIYNYRSTDFLNKEISREVMGNDMMFNEIR